MIQPALDTDASSSVVTLADNEAIETRIVLQQPTNESRLESCETNDYDDSDSESGSGNSDGGRNNNEIALPSGTIQATVQNSTQTTIAHNFTQITGPVSINHYHPSNQNGDVNRTQGITNGATPGEEGHTGGNNVKKSGSTTAKKDGRATLSHKHFFKTHKRIITLTLVGLILIVLATSITLSLVLLFPTSENHSTHTTTEYPLTSITEHPLTTITEHPLTSTTENPDDVIQVISKKQWGGRDPVNVTYGSGSVSLVVVKHTGGKYCHDFRECASTLQELQSYHVGTNHSSDIWYNFLIGGDGNIYEGRGWNVQNEGRKDSVDICYMGDFDVDVPTEKMITAGKQVVINGIITGYLFYNYNVVNHNQTENTTSPGKNIYTEVTKWPNYYGNLIPSNYVVTSKIIRRLF